MNIIIVSNYFYPEIGAAPSRITNLAVGLAGEGAVVEVICPMPNYPKGEVFKGYENRLSVREIYSEGVSINRYWIYPSISKKPLWRILSMLSFSVSLWMFISKPKKIFSADWIIIQNSPLLVSFSAVLLFGVLFRKKIALNVSDLWPLSALELGAMQEGVFYKVLELVELFNYRHSNLIIGQSKGILQHVYIKAGKEGFLYRNLQPGRHGFMAVRKSSQGKKTFLYAGLLGVAQGVYDIVSNIDFSALGAELHIYGEGNEKASIVNFISRNPNNGVFYKGAINQCELHDLMPFYHASIVPLVSEIKGAVPSKLYELAKYKVPIIFSGGGEGEILVKDLGIGIVTPPRDYAALRKAISYFVHLSADEIEGYRLNCESAARLDFNFEKQLEDLVNLLVKWGKAA